MGGESGLPLSPAAVSLFFVVAHDSTMGVASSTFPSVPSCRREGYFSDCSGRGDTGQAALRAAPELRRAPHPWTFRAQGLEYLPYSSVPVCPSATPALSSLAKDGSVSANLLSPCGFDEVSATEQEFSELRFLRGAGSRGCLRG